MSHRDHSPKRKCHVTLEVKAAQELTLEGDNFNAQWWQAGCGPKELVVHMRSILPGVQATDEAAKEYTLEEKVPFVNCKPDTSKWEDALLEARDNCEKILQSHLTGLFTEHTQNLDRIREQFASRIKEEDQLHEMRANALRDDYNGRLDWLHEQEQVIKALGKREGHWGPGDWPNYRMPLNLKDNQEDWENEEEQPEEDQAKKTPEAVPQTKNSKEESPLIIFPSLSGYPLHPSLLVASSSDYEDSDEDSDDEEILDNLDLLDRYEIAREKGNKNKASRIAGIVSDRMEKEEDPDIMELIVEGGHGKKQRRHPSSKAAPTIKFVKEVKGSKSKTKKSSKRSSYNRRR